MEKVLNQEEIDAMVRAARGRAVAQQPARPKIQPWNFRQAGQIGRDQMRAVTQLHESFARNLTHSLGAYLRVVFDANLVSVEQLTYGEFLSRLPELAYLATCRLEPVSATSALQLDLGLAFPIIDLLLGGQGAAEPELRDLTEIEEQILEGVVRVVCRELESAWQPLGMTVGFDQRQHAAQMQRLMPPSEKAMSLSFEVRMAASRGMLNFIVPSAAANILLRKLSHDWDFRRPRGLHEANPQLAARLLECPFDIELGIPEEPVAADKIVSLDTGGVLPLSRPVDAPAWVVIDGQACFSAEIVRKNMRRAAHISDRGTPAERTAV